MIPARFKSRWLNQSAILIYGVIAFFALALAWSFWAELDQLSRAPGQVIPAGRIQVIQSSEGGQIEEILVKEGDIVKKGQLMVKLEDVKLRASVSEAEGRVASLKSSMARINAELFDRPLSFPPEVRRFPKFVNNQTLLYTKRRQALEDQLSALEEMHGLIRQELDMNMPLLKQGDVSKADILRMQRGVSDIESQIVNVRNKYLQDLQTEYTRTEEDLMSAREILAQRADSMKDTQIRASVDGIVKNVQLTTIGGVLRPSDEVLSIVPTGDDLIVEAKMSPKDIAYVLVGQEASVKFDAYDASIYGSALGEVTYISPDTLSEKSQAGDDIYYRVHIEVDTSPMKPHLKDEVIEIQPGMTATAEIQVGRNTVWKYLTKPINKTFSEAMTER
ncbi:MAG: HlyD family efflux transporter periplasmic adaptor subunit [Sphingomonadaceae bacterium]|nr:HlyD family efflux transporter periplasmic adaptor subunit [Sphingomonadaceae bacterium]